MKTRKFRIVLCECVTLRRLMTWTIEAEKIEDAVKIGETRYLKNQTTQFIGAESL